MTRTIRISLTAGLLAGAGLTLLAAPALAQPRQAAAPPPAGDPRVSVLEQELRDVQAQLVQIKQAQADADATAALADLKRSTSDQYVDLGNQIATAQAGQTKVGLDNGRLTIASADGRFTLALRGLVQYDYGYFGQGKNGSVPDLSSGANFRRAQIGIQGTAWRDWAYNLTLDFAGNGVEKSGYIYSAYVEYDGFRPFGVRIGAYAPPAGIEDATGSADLLFLERPAAADAARNLAGSPSRDSITIFHQGEDHLLALSYTGNKAGDSGAFDEQQALVGRAAWLAVSTPEIKWLLDADLSYVFKPADIVAGTVPATTALSAVSFSGGPELAVDDNAPKLTNTGNIDAKRVTEFGFETAAEYQTLYAQGGYFNYQIDRRNPAIPSPHFDGYYALLAWSLTGESRLYDPVTASFRGLRPASAFGNGGYGAWELKARYSNLNLDFDPLAAASAGGVPGGVQNIWTLGLNWYPTNGLRFALEYDNIHVHHVNAPANDISADALGLRTQLSL